MRDGRISGAEVRALAQDVGASIEDLAREADINTQTVYRKKPTERFGPKSTRKFIEAAKRIEGRTKAKTG